MNSISLRKDALHASTCSKQFENMINELHKRFNKVSGIEDDGEYYYKKYSTIYIVFHEDKPLFYVRSYDEAREKMWDQARKICREYISDYVGYVCEIDGDPDKIEIIGQHRTFFIPVARTFDRLYIKSVKELCNKVI